MGMECPSEGKCMGETVAMKMKGDEEEEEEEEEEEKKKKKKKKKKYEAKRNVEK